MIRLNDSLREFTHKYGLDSLRPTRMVNRAI